MAKAVGLTDINFAKQVIPVMQNVWMPLVNNQRHVRTATHLVDLTRLQSISSLVGNHLEPLADSGISADTTDDLMGFVVLTNLLLRRDSGDVATVAKEIATRMGSADRNTKTIFVAASYEAAYRLTQNPSFHSSALEVTADLALDGGVFAIEEVAYDERLNMRSGSVTATVLAAWIHGTTIPVNFWSDAGFCASDTCADTRAGLPNTQGISLPELAMTRVCVLPGCGDLLTVLF